MYSIRSHLAFRLLIGFALLLSLASLLVYLISKKILESDFDARLFAKGQAVLASISQKGATLDVDWSNLPQELGPRGKQAGWIQVLDRSGHILEGDAMISPVAFPISGREEYRDANLPQGVRLRVLTLPFQPHVEEEDVSATPPGMRQNCILVVGSDRDQLDHSLNQLAGVLAVMTVLTSILSLGVVFLALDRGLRPLSNLSLEVAQIDAASLEKRVKLDSLPTELLPIAEKLNDLLSRLEVSFTRERRFSADVSHELRTPIAELRSLSEIMLRQPNLTSDNRQAFRDVLDASCHMEALVATLLEMVRSERGVSTLEIRKIDLGELFRNSWKSYADRAWAKGLKVAFELPEPYWVESDPRLLGLVLKNLFANAVEYTPSEGSIEIGVRESDGRSVISIQNSTENVSPEDLSHFFERFWRKDNVRSNSEHMGLGLSLIQVFCQRLQIHLTVSMPKPNRVRFWLALNAPSHHQ